VQGDDVRSATRLRPDEQSDEDPRLGVLVVDDSKAQRYVLATYLRRWGFLVEEAESADQALARCSETFPDIVMSDWVMPGLSGPEFCRRFRILPRENYGYFILLTSKSEKDEVAIGLDAGADDFLTKPVNAAELRARLAAGCRILQMERELTEKNRLIKSTLDELQTLYDSIDSDLIEAKRLQQSLLSERYRDFGVAQLSMALHSAGHVGGDLVGTFPISEGRIGLYGIDVSGHGVSSALMTARLASYLSATVPEQNLALEQLVPGRFVARPPAETVARLNHIIMSDIDTDHYFTIALADVDLASGRVLLAQAGHPHPAVQRASGAIEFVGCGGLPVGLIGDARFDQVSFTLAPGDRLLIYSDGLTECPAPDGRLLDEVGLARLMGDLRQTRGPAFLESLMWKLADHAQDQDFADDVSALLLEFREAPRPC
jgi:sigma-B regulation protein RsbU (phosphoserine phosphatase)